MSNPFWLSDEEISEVVRLAHGLREAHPGARFFGLGQSPAWIIEALQLDATRRGQYVETGLIPFSGCFDWDGAESYKKKDYTFVNRFDFSWLLGSKKDLSTTLGRKKGLQEFLSQPYIKTYKTVLERLGADPATIVRKHKETGIKTVISDFICRGRGMSSFLFLSSLFARADKIEAAYREAVFVHLFEPHHEHSLYAFRPVGCFLFTTKTGGIDWHTRDTLWNDNSARLVAHYRKELWASQPYPVAPGPVKTVLKTYKKLRAEIERQASVSSAPERTAAATSPRPSREARP